ncbi:MAG: site-specific DNA-methyltransferase [Melioribacter sp.]|nr:site-specific DNA-methyltransferase [Melioribacter sp.]
MSYTIYDIQERSPVVAEKIEKYIKTNKIKVGKKGQISDKSYLILLDLFSSQEEIKNDKKNGKPVNVLNDLKIQINHKPIFKSQDQRISLFHDDAISFLKSLPTASVDIIITDPAYSGMNQRLKLGRGKIIGKYADAGKDGAKWFEEFHDTVENYKTFLQQCYRVLRNNRHIYIMFDSYSLLSLAPIARDVFEVKNVLCWDKANIGLGHYFRRRHEFILFASKGKRHLNSKSIPDVWKIKRVVSSEYPTQKPTEVFELMLKGSAEKDFVVCDPFVGSGSSAIAAIKSDCMFIGCDTSEKAISVSKERIKQFLKNKTDLYQKSSLLGDDEAITKLFLNGESK